MSNKVTLPQLASAIAELTSSNGSTAESFLKSLFELIADTLTSGDSVTIKGIGTFEAINDPNNPILWTPDTELAETVNQPFAFFEPVELGDDVTEDTLLQPIEEEAEDVAEQPTESADDAPAESAEVPAIVIPPIPKIVPPAIPPIPTQKPEETPEEEPVVEEQPTTEEEIPATEEEQPATEEEPTEITAEETPVITEETPIVEEETQAEEPTYPDYLDEDEPRRFNYLPWITLILGFVLGFAAKYTLDYYYSAVPIAESVPTDTIAPQPEVAADTIQPEPTDTVQPTPAEPVKTLEPLGTGTVTSTCYLTTLSRRYYGNYKFWVYIYEENADKISDPNRIKPGTTVVIPNPAKYGIDANNPESVSKAEAKIAEIQSKKVK